MPKLTGRGGPGRNGAAIPVLSKRCTGCDTKKPINLFPSDGKGGIYAKCKDCHNLKNSLWKAKRQAKVDALIQEARLSGCIICGEADPVVLDFHHLDSSQKDNDVMKLAKRRISFDRVKAEIEKCVVICANCHRRLHVGTVTLPEVKYG